MYFYLDPQQFWGYVLLTVLILFANFLYGVKVGRCGVMRDCHYYGYPQVKRFWLSENTNRQWKGHDKTEYYLADSFKDLVRYKL